MRLQAMRASSCCGGLRGKAEDGSDGGGGGAEGGHTFAKDRELDDISKERCVKADAQRLL